MLSIFLTLVGLASAKAQTNQCSTVFHKLKTTIAQHDPFEDPPSDQLVLRHSNRYAGGSQDGKWFIDQKGRFHFGKSYDGNEPRLIAEHLANQTYLELGVAAAKTRLRRVDGIPYLLSEEIAENQVQDHARLVDVLLANRDVLGAEIFGDLNHAYLAGRIRLFIDRYAKSRDRLGYIYRGSGLSESVARDLLETLDTRAAWIATQGLRSVTDPAKLEEEFKAQMSDGWNETVAELRETARRPSKKLTDAELIALDGYLGGEYQSMNSALRGTPVGGENWTWLAERDRSSVYFEAHRPEIELTISALSKLNSYAGVVKRAANLDTVAIDQYQVGKVHVEKGFLSTSMKHGEFVYTSPNVIFEIVSKTGKSVHFMKDSEDREREVLFAPNTEFLVSAKQFDGSTWSIKMIEL